MSIEVVFDQGSSMPVGVFERGRIRERYMIWGYSYDRSQSLVRFVHGFRPTSTRNVVGQPERREACNRWGGKSPKFLLVGVVSANCVCRCNSYGQTDE
jgi:hypothetical protein